MTYPISGLRHPNSDRLIAYFRSWQQGQQKTYSEILEETGLDISSHGGSYCYYATARRTLLREHIVLTTLSHEKAVRRSEDVEIISNSENDAKRLRRASRRTLAKLASVKYENLPQDQQVKHTLQSAMLSAVYEFAGNKAKNHVADRITGPQPINFENTLKLFLEKK